MSSKNARLLPHVAADPTFIIVFRILIVVAIMQLLAAFIIVAPRLVSTVAGQLANRTRLHEALPASLMTAEVALGQKNQELVTLPPTKLSPSLQPTFSSREPSASLLPKELSSKKIASGSESGLQPGADLGIISIEHSAGNEGEQILKIAIKSHTHEAISVPDVKVQVYFYDQLNGETIASKSPVTSRWLNPPVDWKSGDPQLLEVTYQSDNNNPDAHYAGYVVAVYYKGELQGYRADPSSITSQFPIKVYIGRDDL